MTGIDTNGRNPLFDNARFLLMGLVVLGHAISRFSHELQWVHNLYIVLYSFHVPAFVFIAGHFSKTDLTSRHFSNILRKLVLPYLVFQFLFLILDHVLNKTFSFDLTFVHPYRFMWFLLSLASWRLLLPFFSAIRGGFILSVSFALVAGFFEDVGIDFSLSRTIYFFPFFYLGHLTTETSINKLSKVNFRIVSICVIGAFIIWTYFFGHGVEKYLLWGSRPYVELNMQGLTGPIYRFVVYLIAVGMGAAFISLVPRGKTIFTSAGARSIYPYILHGTVVHILISHRFYREVLRGDDADLVAVLLLVGGMIVYPLLCSPLVKTLTRFIIEPSIRQASFVAAGLLVCVATAFTVGSIHHFDVPETTLNRLNRVSKKEGMCTKVDNRGLTVDLGRIRYSKKIRIHATGDSEIEFRAFKENISLMSKALVPPSIVAPWSVGVAVSIKKSKKGYDRLLFKPRGSTGSLCIVSIDI